STQAAPVASALVAPAEARLTSSESREAAPLPEKRRVARPPSPGFINIYAEPWAYVIVDGKRAGTTPMMKLPLAAGSHRVRLESPGRRAVQRIVNVTPRQTQLLNVDLDSLANDSVAHQ